MKRLLLALVLSFGVATAAPTIDFRYERDLIDMFDNPNEYAGYEKEAMGDAVCMFIRKTIRDHVAGRIVLSPDDLDYLARMGTMACDILNWQQYGYEE